jgi:hypothetical protein
MSVEFVYFIYDSNLNTDCGLSSIANISGTQCITRSSVRHLFPGVLVDDDGALIDHNEEMMSELNVFRILTKMHLMHGGRYGPDNIPLSLLPTHNTLDDYVTKVHTSNETAETITALIDEKPFFIMFLNVADTTHYVPVVRFGERWIIMGGERRSLLMAIEHDTLPTALTTQAGRNAILEHCRTPFDNNLTVEFLGANLFNIIVPKHPGPRERNTDMEGFPKSEVAKRLPWAAVSALGQQMPNFKKEYAVFIKTEQFHIPTLDFK